ncbi:MAG TPA: SRPBCC domain-containing protein [Candidatus Eisenbacteria bacterium]
MSDPSRRALLDLLYQRNGRSLADLDGHLPMTRFGTMKHLRVLESAGLVATRRVGRHKLHYLNPVPIRLIHDRWITKYAAPWVGALGHLKRELEETMHRSPSSPSVVAAPRHLYEIVIRATPDQIWEAITRPERTRDYFYGTLVASDWKPGSPLRYAYPDGKLAAEGTVLEADPPRRLVHSLSALWDPEVTLDHPHQVVWTIEPLGRSCRVRVEHHGFEGETATLRSVQSGLSVILSGMKTLLETGQRLEIGG